MTIALLALGCGGGSDAGTPPSTTAIAKTTTNSGDAQSGTVGEPLVNPLQVLVTDNGTASSGVTVSWSAGTGGGSLDPASGVTDGNGIASTFWTLGTTAGAQTAQAALTGAAGSPVSFTATAAAGPAAALEKAAGDGQTGTINAQLASPVQAKVQDQFGNGVGGVAVTWAAVGATVSAGSVPSDAAGISQVQVTLGGTAGQITITADAGAIGAQTFTATATAVAPATISVVNNAFSPSAITISAHTTVTWTWGTASFGHNIVPDNGTTPATSGALANSPHSYQFTFDTPGTYRYYCANHGGPGGLGMSGTVTVQ
ncbi:MAG: plastocyanin/azurin family copper-binding protein [Gemmatimonadales bacterium]